MRSDECRRDDQPWTSIPSYYMPQLAINMEVFAAEYAYLMCWTQRGASLFYVERSESYWQEVRSHSLLCALWWTYEAPRGLAAVPLSIAVAATVFAHFGAGVCCS
jgi:hypothetical protein